MCLYCGNLEHMAPENVPVDIALPTPLDSQKENNEAMIVKYLGVSMSVATMNAMIEQQNK